MKTGVFLTARLFSAVRFQSNDRDSDMGKSGHESRLGHDLLTLKRLQKSRDQVVTRDHFVHVWGLPFQSAAFGLELNYI